MKQDMGASASAETGSREPDPQAVPALSGFDPARVLNSTERKRIKAFASRLVEAGAELLGPTNPSEVLRFRARTGIGVIYTGRRGEKWNAEARAALEHLNANRGSLAPVQVRGRRTDRATVSALLGRDGGHCFFCDLPLGDDVTVEHLVAVAHGGPNHISNLFLAHAECNQRAGHLSAPEKVAIAIEARSGETPSGSTEGESAGRKASPKSSIGKEE